MRKLAVVGSVLLLGAVACSIASAQELEPAEEASLPLSYQQHEDEKPRRPRVLIPLYISASVLGVLDIQTTLHGRSHGAQEANPLVSGLEDHPVQMSLLKGLALGVAVASSEALWKNGHPRLAIASMIVLNGIAAAVVLNNLKTIATQEGYISPVPEPRPELRPGDVEIRIYVRFGR